MNITLVGAAGGEVTGSAYYVQTKQSSILVDCGLFQGGKKAETLNRPPTTAREKVDAVLITRGHLDHTGRLPLLAWFSAIAPSRLPVVLTHGENGPRETLAKLIQQRFKLTPQLPGMMEAVEL